MALALSMTAALPRVADAATVPAGATAVASAISAQPGLVTGAAFQTQPPGGGGGATAGTSDDAIGQFPRHGDSYGVLSSGLVTSIPNPGTFASTDLGGGSIRGNSDRDVTILKVDLAVPAGANCLTLDFKFLTEEFPRYVGGTVNDAFIAELDTSTWTTSGSVITAPDNFAFDAAGDVVSVNSTGVGGMTPAEGAGTAFDGVGGNSDGAATTLLSAAKQVTPGSHALYLSIFDQGDTILDSAVFLDNLRAGYVPDPAVNCKSGAQVVTHSLALTPATGTADVGTEHTVTATVLDSNGAAVTDGTVEFTVTGAHAVSQTVPVAADGTATLTYPGTATGADAISACFRPVGATTCTATATADFTWTTPPIGAALFGGNARCAVTLASNETVTGSVHSEGMLRVGSRSTHSAGPVTHVGQAQLGSNTDTWDPVQVGASNPVVYPGAIDVAALQAAADYTHNDGWTVAAGATLPAGVHYVDGDVQLGNDVTGEVTIVATGLISVGNNAQLTPAVDGLSLISTSSPRNACADVLRVGNNSKVGVLYAPAGGISIGRESVVSSALGAGVDIGAGSSVAGHVF